MTAYYGGDKSTEFVFQNDMIRQMLDNGWLLGKPKDYNREYALYPADLLAFVRQTQKKQWDKFTSIYKQKADAKFIELIAAHLNKANPNATDKELRTYGTLGALRHDIRHRGTRFSLCQFKPEHTLNPDTLANYQANRLRLVPELVYSPWATAEHEAETGTRARRWRIDLVLFVNGLPVITLELKSEFKQSVENAKKQYKKTRLPKDPETKKPEPLLTFKRGALVHFAVSQYEIYMTTQLAGDDTFFLPFNQGTKEGGAGNDTPTDKHRYATEYLWNEVLLPDNLLTILGRYMHLAIEEKEDASGRKYKKEKMIFPRYHQWDVVNRLIQAAKEEGPGHNYLIQHSAGSGKSNSIAWSAHQLSALHDDSGRKVFDSIIVITDRTVLDDQLQDTIYQFEHQDGVVGRINRREGDGSKSEKLAAALEGSQPIIIVTIQTFPFVLKAIEDNVSLKTRCYAIIADEAHSSQSGQTARKLKEVLMIEGRDAADDTELSSSDALDAIVDSRRASSNLSYLAFTATPKGKTLQLFGRCPDPDSPPAKDNKPGPWHEYTMQQAIEEDFILDVLKNYTNYSVAHQLALKHKEADTEVERKQATKKLNQWVRLHAHNINQKVKIIVEHYKEHIMPLLDGQAKAMVVTSSRKEVVRYKVAFDAYIKAQDYTHIQALVAFSGDVTFDKNDFDSADTNNAMLLDRKFNEGNMNPGLKGRDMRDAFDHDDYQLMLVANKFQTGFDQPKLCAMYVDKALGDVECVQTLSRLNRIYPGKAESGSPYVLDFYNDPQVILDAFRQYYKTAELADVSDPDRVYDLFERLNQADIYRWHEVEQFCEAFFSKNKTSAALSNICKPAVERWQKRYRLALEAYRDAEQQLQRAQENASEADIANASSYSKTHSASIEVSDFNSQRSLEECKREKDRLEIFKKDLGTYCRFYEFMSQIVDYGEHDLEQLNIYARHLRPLLREDIDDEDEIDLSNISMTHYRIRKIKQQDLKLHAVADDPGKYQIQPGNDAGSASPKSHEEELLSTIIQRLNEMFADVPDSNLTEGDLLNYAHTVRDKVRENKQVMQQISDNTPEQAMLGDFPDAIDTAVMESNEAHQKMMLHLLSNPEKNRQFTRLIFQMLTSPEPPTNP